MQEMRVMQTAGIKKRRTKGGNDGVKGEETDEIIEQDGGIYRVVLQHKSVRLLSLSPRNISDWAVSDRRLPDH